MTNGILGFVSPTIIKRVCGLMCVRSYKFRGMLIANRINCRDFSNSLRSPIDLVNPNEFFCAILRRQTKFGIQLQFTFFLSLEISAPKRIHVRAFSNSIKQTVVG